MAYFDLIWKSFLLGVAVSPLCFGTCSALLLPFYSMEYRKTTANWKALVHFFMGRLLGYLIIGALAGFIGKALLALFEQGQMNMVKAVAYIVLGCLLLLFIMIRAFPHWSFCTIAGKWANQKHTVFLLGFLTGINICPPFVSAIFEAMQSGGWLNGMIVLASFFVGTSLILLPLPLAGWFAKEQSMQAIGKIAGTVVGLWFLIQGISYLL